MNLPAWAIISVWFLLAAAIPATVALALFSSRRAPFYYAATYLALLMFFPNASWGLTETTAGSNFYTRGTGIFYFSAINVFLFLLSVQAFFSRRFSPQSPVTHNLKVPAVLFSIILISNVAIALLSKDIAWYQLVSYSGLLNIVNLMLAFYVLTSIPRTPHDLDRLASLLLFCAVSRGIWGAVRYVALGGDPANFYANFQNINIKITFFDINDSLIAMMAIVLAVWRLSSQSSLRPSKVIGYWGIIVLELFIIVFSQRRSAWGGLLLVVCMMMFVLHGKWRWGLMSTFTAIGIPLLSYKMVMRSGHTAQGSVLERMFPDIMQRGELSFTTGRFSELYAAWLSLKSNLVFGLGAWGRYDGFRFSELAWHQGNFAWMHSGLLHIILKTGLVGLGIALATLWLHGQFVRKTAPTLPLRQKGVLLAGAAGTLFMLPTWLIGTPIIEYRTMQLQAFCLVLPYLAAATAGLRTSPASESARDHQSSGMSFAAAPT